MCSVFITEITSFFFQSASAVMRQQERVCSEKGITQQLQILQVQDTNLTETSQMPLPDDQAKQHCVDSSEQVLLKKQGSEQHPSLPVRGHSDQQPAQNSGGPGGEPSMVGEAPSMKLEVGPTDIVNQVGTDPFWRTNALTQTTQVKILVTENPYVSHLWCFFHDFFETYFK